ncbi:MAG TPA: branched-chain amino acid ABC transporter substrate-binding protein [Candidatus Limnocylindrales bacterium]|nr:branched-chain amino acid ABC transporter substrate-binding protein [Candidatus Limnocylindrales bacterium]
MYKPKVLAAIGVAGMVLAACGNGGTSGGTTSKGTIKIGVDLPESGSEASNGIPTLRGVQFAVQQVGSVDGFTLQVDNLDDAVSGVHDPQKGAQNVTSFVNDPTVLGMVGPFNSNVARAEIPITNRAHLVQISPANTNQCLTKNDYIPTSLSGKPPVSCATAGLPAPSDLRPTGTNNYFRVATTDDLQGPAMADYAYNTLHLTKVGVASDNEVYGKGIADTFTSRFVADGGTVVKRQDFDTKSTNDFRPFLQQAKAGGAQGIYFGGTDSNKACIVRSQESGGILDQSTPFMGGDGIVTQQCLNDAASFATGMYGTVATVDADQVPAAKATIDAFNKQYPNKTTDYGAYTMPAYDCAKILIAAIDRAIKGNSGNMPTRQMVLDQMAKTDYNGALGHTAFDSNGDTLNKVITVYGAKGTPVSWQFVVGVTEQ